MRQSITGWPRLQPVEGCTAKRGITLINPQFAAANRRRVHKPLVSHTPTNLKSGLRLGWNRVHPIKGSVLKFKNANVGFTARPQCASASCATMRRKGEGLRGPDGYSLNYLVQFHPQGEELGGDDRKVIKRIHLGKTTVYIAADRVGR